MTTNTWPNRGRPARPLGGLVEVVVVAALGGGLEDELDVGPVVVLLVAGWLPALDGAVELEQAARAVAVTTANHQPVSG